MSAQDWISKLSLTRHPEGGYYCQSFVSDEEVHPDSQTGARRLYTSIYFLLESGDVSRFHRLKSDELWYYHIGSSLTIHTIDSAGSYEAKKLGLNLEDGERPQVLIKAGTIFGATIDEDNAFSLVGCMVAPGFVFEDFELFERRQLLEAYGQHESIIRRLTKE
ncbi:cupin domain-containing protein [Planococcus lenghuensis]|uniref:Cupin n=1 Tax=Planococcus lenghuensis TaxID=2213202 RepID=A0A1Q2KZC4_9BACL|nr:cupin domain-containing protein [Planococcus lenghuensis]AQQ53550.1 cupin [Planococcus lenghuensis]